MVSIPSTLDESMSKVVEEYYGKYGIKSTNTKPPSSSSTSSSSWSKGTTTHTFKKKDCKHWRDKIELAKGIIIHACAHRDHPTKNENWYYPEYGVYFASSWDDFSPNAYQKNTYTTAWDGPVKPPPGGKDTGEAKVAVIDWPDFGAPRDTDYTLETLEFILNKAGEGKNVEVGCIGGHGRTGTALAAMLIMLGQDNADEAVKWVQTKYCEHAVESKSQEEWLWDLACTLHPETAPELRKKIIKKKDENKSGPLVGTTMTKSSQHGSSHLHTIDINDEDQLQKWWFEQAYKEYIILCDNLSGKSTATILDSVIQSFGLKEHEVQAFYDYVGGRESGTIDDRGNDLTQEKIDVTLGEWEEINENILRAQGALL